MDQAMEVAAHIASLPPLATRVTKESLRSGLDVPLPEAVLGDLYRFAMLERQHKLWDEAGIKVTSISMGDPMGWCRPWIVKDDIIEVKKRWPEIVNWRFHFHNGRGLALASTYAALDALEAKDTLYIDTAVGGIGGCPYAPGAAGNLATEDLLYALDGLGIEGGGAHSFDEHVRLDSLPFRARLLALLLEEPGV